MIKELEAAGRTAVVVLLDGVPAGLLGLADRLRPDAAATVAAPDRADRLDPGAAHRRQPLGGPAAGREVGITDVRAALLPGYSWSSVC